MKWSGYGLDEMTGLGLSRKLKGLAGEATETAQRI